MRAALAAAALAPEAVCALEMHGTGTALGDPIEVGAAAAVLQVRPCSHPGHSLHGSVQCLTDWPPGRALSRSHGQDAARVERIPGASS